MSKMIPYVPASNVKTPEFTVKAVILGVVLGLIFGVGNAYLGLRIGTTVSASIPAAVMSMAILRTCFKKVSILENNMVQTIASVGEGLAGGVIFTVPALFLLGAQPSMSRIFLLSALGGVLGVLFMIPMRRHFIVKEHTTLPYPEGTACAAILKSGQSAGVNARMAFIGIFVGVVYQALSGMINLFRDVVTWTLPFFQKTEFSLDSTPSLLGVGYIIGPRICALLFSGGALAWWVIIPLIKMFGEGQVVIFPGHETIASMSAEAIWSNYVRYIGAGTMAVGGILSLCKIAPLIAKTLHASFLELFEGVSFKTNVPRTDRDISLKWLIIGAVSIILILWLYPGLPINFLTIVLLIVLGLFFVAVTSLTVGLVGSTSSPVSGMLITILLLTCLLFVLLGWTERIYLIAALTMSVVANVAIALAGTTSQDLKTGYLLGATPRLQQIGEIIGVIVPALTIGATLYMLDKAYGFGSPQLPAPQATMMALIAQGVMEGSIPITLFIAGIVIGVILELVKLPILPFALGLYLPLSLSTATLVGGIVAHFVKKKEGTSGAFDRGVLAASGLVAGGACMGVLIALLTVLGVLSTQANILLPDWVSLVVYVLAAIGLGWYSLRPQAKRRA